MRTFRTTAIAGATALSLVASMIGVANAQTTESTTATETTTSTTTSTETATPTETSAPEPSTTVTTDPTTPPVPGWDLTAPERETLNPPTPAPKCEFKLDLTKVDTQNPNCLTKPLNEDLKDAVQNPKAASSIFGKRFNADKDVRGTDLLGQVRNFGALPEWAQIWYIVTVLGVIGSVIGLGFLPLMNYLKNIGVIK